MYTALSLPGVEKQHLIIEFANVFTFNFNIVLLS